MVGLTANQEMAKEFEPVIVSPNKVVRGVELTRCYLR